MQTLAQNALKQPRRRPRTSFTGRPQQLALRGGPPPTLGDQHLCATPRGAPHSGTAYPGRPHRRVDLVVQLPPAGSAAYLGSAPRPGTRAHRPADRTPTCTKPQSPDASHGATERRHPQHVTLRWPRVLGKQDSQGGGSQPPANEGMLHANKGAGGTPGTTGARHPQHRHQCGVGKRPPCQHALGDNT